MYIYVYAALIICYIASQFAFGAILNWVIGFLAIASLIYSVSYAKGLYLRSGIAFLIGGFILFLYNKLVWYAILLHFKPMLGLLALFLVLPFINSLLRVGHYEKKLSLLLQDNITTLDQLYRRSFIICFILGIFLNIAVFPLLIKSLHLKLQYLEEKIRNKFYARNLLRAFFLTITWSPMEVMVSTSLDITKVKYYTILPIIVSIIILAIIFDWIFVYYKLKKINITLEQTQKIIYKNILKKIIQLIIMLLVLIICVSLTEFSLNKGFLLSIVIVLFPFSTVWSIFIRKPKRYCKIAIPYWKERIRGLANYFFMFLSAGFFIEMLSMSGILNLLQPLILIASVNPITLYVIIAAYFLVTSLSGIHPLVAITFLSGLLQPVIPHVEALPLTIVLISCSLAPTLYSPYNLSASILADQLKVNPYKIGSWNLWFAIFYMSFTIAVAHILGIMLG